MSKDYSLIEEKHRILIEKAVEQIKLIQDPQHSLSHVLQVVEYTKEILQDEKADEEVCIISAYWHDVGRLKQNEGHALISAELLKEEMQKLNYSEDMIEKCYKAIYKHSWYDNPETIEGIVVRDADKLDFVGIKRWNECIEKNCDSIDSILKLLPTTREELLKLDTSKKIFDKEIAKLVAFLYYRI